MNILIKIALLQLVSLIFCDVVQNDEDEFYYFAYGSNLLARRLHINNPSAVFYSSAKLENYRLDFYKYFELWRGAVATICEDTDDVWGALWKMNLKDMTNLDKQEGVDRDWYFAKNVTVTTPNGTQVTARTYIEVNNPPKLQAGEIPPRDRLPSETYLKVILIGAIESGLPTKYIEHLMTIPTNGSNATDLIRQKLGSQF